MITTDRLGDAKAMLDSFRTLVVASAPPPTVEGEIKFGEYTAQEYRDLWIDLSALALAYLEACHLRYAGEAERLTNSRVLILTRSDIVRLVSRPAESQKRPQNRSYGT